MAEYYAVLKKLVRGDGAGSAEARRTVYEEARNVLLGQLKTIDPPLTASQISRQRLELEEAIRRIERETLADLTPPPRQAGPSPQEIFRRAVRDAEARRAASGYSAERPPAARGRARREDQGWSMEPVGNRVQGRRPEYRSKTQKGDAATLAPEYDDRQDTATTPSKPYPEPRRLSRPPGRREDDDEEAAAETSGQPERRSHLPTILLLILIVCMIGGLGAFAWSQRTDLLASLDGGPTDGATPGAVPAPPDTKSEDRLADAPATGSSVRVVGEAGSRNVLAPPDASTDPIADAIADSAPATVVGEAEPRGMQAPPGASTDAITVAISDTGSAAAGGRTAMLYEEPLDPAAAASGVRAIDAVVDWRFVEDGAGGPEIAADLRVPEVGMNIRLVIRRVTDPTLPASHLVEAVITTPPDFPGKEIRSMPRLVLKPGEKDRGEPLIGAAAKVAEGAFWIGLSAAEADLARNLQLLRESSWIDLPLVYATGQRAILTFEKGPQGAEVFDSALAAWTG
jgi:hypothetical protein